MSTINLKSSDVLVAYPCSRRAESYYPTSRLYTEKNIVSVVNRLVDKDSFVVKDDEDEDIISFNIHGYYFEVNRDNLVESDEFQNANDIYAYIYTNKSDGGMYEELSTASSNVSAVGLDSAIKLDSEDKFIGLYFSDTSSDKGTYENLHLLTKSGTSWKVPDSSRVRFIIDDGELT